jgi:hypothetical protein
MRKLLSSHALESLGYLQVKIIPYNGQRTAWTFQPCGEESDTREVLHPHTARRIRSVQLILDEPEATVTIQDASKFLALFGQANREGVLEVMASGPEARVVLVG